MAYKSPEQAEGKEIDHRSDIFSLGILMYEMVSGASPFTGDTKVSIMSSIVKDTPTSITELNPRVPRHLGRIIKQSLEKDVTRRYQSALDLRNQLEDLQREVASGEVQPVGAGIGRAAPGRGRGAWMLAGAVVVGALAVALAIMVSRPTTGVRSVVAGDRQQVTRDPGQEAFAAISPDARMIAFSKAADEGPITIYTQQIAGGRANRLTDTVAGDQIWPQWSPSGELISFSANGNAYVAPAFGGRARLVAVPEANGDRIYAVAWSPDGGELAYATIGPSGTAGVYVKPFDTEGESRKLAAIDEVFPLTWSPDGRRLAFSTGNSGFLLAGNIAPASLWVLAVDGESAAVRVIDDGYLNQSPVWTPDGDHLMFVSNRGGGLDVYQVEVAASGAAVGTPVRVTSGLDPYSISLSADGGKLAYSEYRATQNIWSVPLVEGVSVALDVAEQVTRGDQLIEALDFSPDGLSLAFDSSLEGNQDIYSMVIADGEPVRLSTDPADDFAPTWSPDGSELVFHSFRTGNRDIYLMAADGTSTRQLTNHEAHDRFPHWSPDGLQIVFQSGRSGRDEIWVMTRDANEVDGGKPRQLTTAGGVQPRWSPDGGLIAYGNSDGLWVIPAEGGAPVRIGESSQTRVPRWSPDGRTVFYRLEAPDSGRAAGVWAVPVEGGVPRNVLRFESRSGFMPPYFAIDRGRLFFPRGEYEGDIWSMNLDISSR